MLVLSNADVIIMIRSVDAQLGVKCGAAPNQHRTYVSGSWVDRTGQMGGQGCRKLGDELIGRGQEMRWVSRWRKTHRLRFEASRGEEAKGGRQNERGSGHHEVCGDLTFAPLSSMDAAPVFQFRIIIRE